MNNRWLHFGCILALLTLLSSGCKKQSLPETPDPVPAEATQKSVTNSHAPALKVHWAGKQALSGDTNAAELMKIWGLPESRRLEAQTLDKLALSLWRDDLSVTNWVRINFGDLVAQHPHASKLRPLLQDFIEQESLIEVRTDEDGPSEVILAVRVDAEGASRWSNSIQSLQGEFKMKGLSVTHTNHDGWTAVNVSRHSSNTNRVADPGREWLQRQDLGTNWLIILFDGAQWPILSSLFLSNAPTVSASVTGDGENVKLSGNLAFPAALGVTLDEWLTPTNLMPHPLVGLTAVRGIATALRDLQVFSDLAASDLPNQAFAWNRPGPPVQFFFAVPSKNPTNLLERLAPGIIRTINSNAPPERYGLVMETNNALLWTYFQYASPHMRVATNLGHNYLMGGFGLHMRGTNSMPPELFERLNGPEKLVYFDWEVTGERVAHFRYVDDVVRMALDAAHRPRLHQESAAIEWLSAVITNHLGAASTEAFLEAPNRISFSRKSQTGFTAFELNLLLNWLERPEFPLGFAEFFEIDHTPSPRRPIRRQPQSSQTPPQNGSADLERK